MFPSSRSRKRVAGENPSRESIRGGALLDKGDRQSSISREEEEEWEGVGRNFKEESTKLVERSSLAAREGDRPGALPADKSDQRRPGEAEADAKGDIREEPLPEQNDRAGPLLSRDNDTSIGQLMRLTGNDTAEEAEFLSKSIHGGRSFLVEEDFQGTLVARPSPRETDITLLQPAGKTVQDNPPSTGELCSSTIIEEDRAKPVAPLRLKRTTGSNRPTDRLSYGSSAVVHRRCLSSGNSQRALEDPEKTLLRQQRDCKLKRSPPPEQEKKENDEGEEEVNRAGRRSARSDSGSTDKHDSKCGLAVTRRHVEPRQSIAKPPAERITISERSPSRAQQLPGSFTPVEDPELGSTVRTAGNVSKCLPNRAHSEKSGEGSLRAVVELSDPDNSHKDSVIGVEVAAGIPKGPVTGETPVPPELPKRPYPKIPQRTSEISLVVAERDCSSTLKVTGDPGASDNRQLSQIRDPRESSSRRKHRPGYPAYLPVTLIQPKSTDGGSMKLKMRLIRIRDKFVLALSAFAILFTLLLVMDLQMDLGYSGHHLVASHARVKLGDRPDADTVYNNFRRKFLQRMNGSREQADATQGVVEKSAKADTTPPASASSSTASKHYEFPDLVDLVVNGYGVNVDEGVARISGEDHGYNPTIGELRHVAPR